MVPALHPRKSKRTRTWITKLIAEAVSNNQPTYFTGKPCHRQGHVAPRNVANNRCTQCVFKSKPKSETWAYKSLENRKTDILHRVKSQAKMKGIEFNLKVEDLVWNEFCPIFGTKLEYFAVGGRKYNSVSLDRVDPSKGYIPNNVEIISVRANSVKSDMGIKEIRSLLKYMEDHLA